MEVVPAMREGIGMIDYARLKVLVKLGSEAAPFLGIHRQA